METAKEAMIATLQKLPDDVTSEDILRELLFLAKMRRGLEEVDRGETVSHAEVMERLERWLTSAGR